jgi:Fe-S cluster assembly protein SufB
VYSHINEELDKLGIIFTDTDNAVKKYPELMQKYFGTIIPPTDNKFAALNTATWSGGTFIYVPKGVKVPMPLNAYFRINAQKSGQFERTLIIADEGSDVVYVEGCTAPVYAVDSLHSAVVEMVAMKGARIRYVTIQNWSKNVYNLVTQRAHAEKDAHVSWIDANIGSKVNMKYPSIFLRGEGASGEVLSVAIAGDGQIQDSGGKIIHIAPNTTSKIISKSVSKGSGVTTFRGQIRVTKSAANVKSHVSCDALLLDSDAKTNTFPYNNIERNDAMISHEAKVGKISNDEIFYLMSRGISEDDAVAMIVLGFLDDLTKVLPMEYSLELKRLIKLDTSKGVG